ncbi:cation diffusion facilitator family transporter [Methanoregula sp.]|uniref:cation diffusion facilitator family transporter n=1 Tax=Methanoregula sp. TaxID=2052170 RepID=UPI003C774B90
MPELFSRTRNVQKRSADEEKQKTAHLSVLSNITLVLMKLSVGFAVGSLAIISEAIHSGIDLLAAVIAYISVKKASEPPDEIHEFGHGKFEDMSGFFEALLIFAAAVLIMYEAIMKLIHGSPTLLNEDLFGLFGIGILVMGISAVINFYVSSRLMKVAKETESIALESDAWHLRTDVYTSAGIMAGLVLIKLTGILILDQLFAFGVAVIIMHAAYELTVRSFGTLTDRKLSDEEENRIKEILCDHATDFANFHDLRTRRSGADRFIDLHLVVAKDTTVEEAHDLSDHLESDILLAFPRTSITIHIEPCKGTCWECTSLCRKGNSPAK